MQQKINNKLNPANTNIKTDESSETPTKRNAC